MSRVGVTCHVSYVYLIQPQEDISSDILKYNHKANLFGGPRYSLYFEFSKNEKYLVRELGSSCVFSKKNIPNQN